jgi:Tfp pilus assembly protein PilN
MLRTNLATRPFYNERAVRGLLIAVGAILALVCLHALQQGIVLSRRLADARAQVAADDRRARELRAAAGRFRAGIRAADLEQVQSASREANGIIDRRTFSWTELFNLIEATLPDGVMLTAIRPEIERGQIMVTTAVVGRSVADIDQFMDRLEQTGAFFDVLSTDEQTLEEGDLRATLVGRYVPRGSEDVPAVVRPASAAPGGQ